ncbi:MAG: magnesium-protoporphyrin IX monomethyl ester anaerobic oxidative cyclase [Deltaproteobacteria bacterium]|nr:magnesium-protoporphyrin IX monomethyl ester anaerobic oxidative cyclase [Deltaproteobacteria bacterium]
MKALLINPPHKSIGSRLPKEHLPPLGLLSIGGPLIDTGYQVKLLDADFENLKYAEILNQVLAFDPDLVLLGHSGSTSAQPIINDIAKLVKSRKPEIKIVIGGVFPTYHWKEILETKPQIDIVVCGEGEQVILDLLNALQQKLDLKTVKGIAYRLNDVVVKTPPAEIIKDLDEYRVGWELMGNYHYTYWGKKKAVVIQFSRGCPYPCSYCGQSLFWKKWRHRNPQLLADEIEMLHKKYGIEVINFADENPSTNEKEWREFLEALIAKKLKLILVGSIRADNIVRDAECLHLYKQAGFERFLLGIENYDEVVLNKIKKAGSVTKDKEAIQLLRKHNILSMATYVVGFGEETTKDFFKSLKQLLVYDPDQIQLLYVTPHKWTPYFEEIKDKNIIQPDQTMWDYKHQIMEIEHLQPWQVILYVKLIELIMQARPKAIMRWLFHKDKQLRRAMFWYNNIGRRVWFYEWFQFLFYNKLAAQPIKINEFWK